MIYQLDIPIYNANALLIVEPTREEFDELLVDEVNRSKLTDEELHHIFKEMDSEYQGFTNRLLKGGYIVLLKDKSKPVYYIHELFHLAHYILFDRGITLDNDGEAYAYLIGWLADQYYNVVLLSDYQKKK